MEKKSNRKTGRTAIRVSKATEEFFKDNKLTGSGAVSALVLDSFPFLYQKTVESLKENFSREELLTILSASNGRSVDVEVSKLHCVWPIEHEFENFDINKLRGKLSSLSHPELFIIEIWANTFWYGTSPTDDPEEYIK